MTGTEAMVPQDRFQLSVGYVADLQFLSNETLNLKYRLCLIDKGQVAAQLIFPQRERSVRTERQDIGSQ